MSSLVTQQNKELLWGVLAEEGIFDNVPTSVTPQEIKYVFEQILRNLSTNIPAIHAGRLKELHHAKHKAIAEEDYDTAKKIRATISEMEALLPRLEKLEQRKQLAVQAEDFETAKQLKNEIDRIHAVTFSLKELNKVALQSLVIHIPRMAREISARKMGSVGSSVGGGGGGGVVGVSSSVGLVPQVREIYNAEDFHSKKREEIETKLREKEAEMRSYFEVPRPQEIDFSDVPRDARKPAKKNKGGGVDHDDNDDDNDSPLATNSDDMEKIIAERIAARQRDMDEITERMKATNPPPHAAPTPTPREYSTSELDVPTPTSLPAPQFTMDVADNTNGARRVRFQEDTIDDNPILLKLKKKPVEEQ